jgi:hypothetical protein
MCDLDDNDPLDTGIHIDFSDVCIGLLAVMAIGAVVVAVGLLLSDLYGLGLKLP